MADNLLVCYAPAIGISSTTPSRILNFHDNEPQEMMRIVPFLFVKVKYDRTLEQISNVVSSKPPGPCHGASWENSALFHGHYGDHGRRNICHQFMVVGFEDFDYIH